LQSIGWDGFHGQSDERGALFQQVRENAANTSFARRVRQGKRTGKRTGITKPWLVHVPIPVRFPIRLAWLTLRQNTRFRWIGSCRPRKVPRELSSRPNVCLGMEFNSCTFSYTFLRGRDAGRAAGRTRAAGPVETHRNGRGWPQPGLTAP